MPLPMLAVLSLSAFACAQCAVVDPVPIGADGEVRLCKRLANGDLLVAGDFTTLLGVPAKRIARWTAAGPTPLGGGLDAIVRDAIELPNGDLVVGGAFTLAGGAPANFVARWDGSTWSPLGTGPGGDVWSLAARPNGEILAGANVIDRVKRWDGTSWTAIGVQPFLFGAMPVRAMHALPNGDVVISTPYMLQQGTTYFDMARWDGVALQGMPGLGLPGLSGQAQRFVTLQNGDLLAVGSWTGAGIVRWNGTAWNVVPGAGVALGGVYDLCELPDGDWLVGGGFLYIGSDPTAHSVVRRHNGVWSAIGAGVSGAAWTLLPLPNGEVLVGGSTTTAGGQPAANLALLRSTCPPAATPTGAGCVGSGGLLTLAPISLPYCGSIQRSRATGLPANALGVGVLGYSALAVPLSSLLPQGLAGCVLSSTPDELTVLPTVGGAAETALAVPPALALVGAVLHQQVASFELGTAGAVVAIATTNALQLVVGAL